MAGDDQLLVKIAVFGIVMSLMCTAMLGILFANDASGDYDYDEIQSYRGELVSFSGESMLSQTPWVLTHVYTPWNPSLGADGHVTDDGWLFGQDVEYSYIGKAANIKLDTTQKSSRPLSFTEDASTYTVVDGVKKIYGIPVIGTIGSAVAGLIGLDVREYKTVTANNWDYTGYRYVFDPTMPFGESGEGKTVSRDGSLSLVWYNYNGSEGLSGGLDIYGGEILLASYSAADIIADYSASSGFATVYDFTFGGVLLNLSIKFDQSVIEAGLPLMQAWTQGLWSMAVSSTSAGNFFDINNSTSFTATAGNMIQTFIQIYTFDVPSINNPWMDLLLWIMVGLPMTIAMLCVTLRLVNGFRVL